MNVKRILAFVLTLVMTVTPITVNAESDGDYTYTVQNGAAVITGVSESLGGNVVIPSTLDEYTVASIDAYAFFDLKDIESITIPNGVTNIGPYAFYGCKNINGIIIPDSVEYIGENAFYNTAYYNNAQNWENDVLYIGSHLIKAKDTLSDNYEIKNGTLTVANFAFSFCEVLKSVSFPEGIKSIGKSAFSYCENLYNVTIPESVTYIGAEAFKNCTGLKSAVFKNPLAWRAVDLEDNVTKLAGESLANEKTAVLYLTDTYKYCYLFRSVSSDAVGDIDGVDGVNAKDAIYLLYSIFFGEEIYPLTKDCDFNKDGKTDTDDAIYLLYHIFFSEENYPLG